MVWSIKSKQQLKAVGEIERSGSARIMAVVGGAILDQSLRLALEDRMRPDKDRRRFLFRSTGPFGGQNKVILGYLLYMYDKEIHDALDAIYMIRNSFAHNLEMSFDSKDADFVKAMEKLTLHVGKTSWPGIILIAGESVGQNPPIDPVTDGQSRFLVNLKIALTYLLEDNRTHFPHSNIPIQLAAQASLGGSEPSTLP